MIPVNSSNLKAVGSNESTGTLEIEFYGGRVYQYSGVSKSTYDQLMAAESHGRFFHRFIKDRYPTIRIR